MIKNIKIYIDSINKLLSRLRVSLSCHFRKITRGVPVLALGALLGSCSQPFPDGNVFDLWILIRMIPLPTPSISVAADTDRHYEEFSSTVTITPAADESYVDYFDLYWGKGSSRLGFIMRVPATGGPVTATIPANTTISSGADGILAYAKGDLGHESPVPGTAAITDVKQHYIFVLSATTGPVDGDLKTAGAGTNGIDGADNLCNADRVNIAGIEQTRPYKALVVDGINRQACSSANCSSGTSGQIDWVFYPDTDYLRTDGTTPILSTDPTNGIHDFATSIGAIDGANTYWTGLAADWTTEPANNCNSWQNGTNAFNGVYGDGNATTDLAISDGFGGWACDTGNQYLVCVEQ